MARHLAKHYILHSLEERLAAKLETILGIKVGPSVGRFWLARTILGSEGWTSDKSLGDTDASWAGLAGLLGLNGFDGGNPDTLVGLLGVPAGLSGSDVICV